MRTLRPILILAATMTLTACDQPDAAPVVQPVAVTSDTFIAATAEIDDGRLASLVDAFDTDPVGVVDRLERDAGGRSALRRYIAAMLDHDEAARLGRQSAMVLSDPESLARPESQDGGVWYPRAEDAGFFTGGVAAALASKPAQIGDFARGAGRSAPVAEDLETWLSAPVSDLPRPARAAFDDAFRAGAYHAP